MTDPRDHQTAASVDLREYLGVLRRRWRAIAFVTLVALAGTAALALSSPAQYRAEATVRVTPVNVEPGRTVSRPDLVVNMLTEEQVLRSGRVLEAVRERLGAGLTDGELRRGLHSSVPDGTHVLKVGFVHQDPAVAQRAAQTFAEVYLDVRSATAEASLEGRASRVRQRLTEVEGELANLQESFRDGQPTPSQQARHELLLGQAQSLRNDLGQVLILSTSPGEILGDAQRPTRPEPSRAPVMLFLALAGGLLAGTALAFVRDRTDRRVRDVHDVERDLGLPVLAQLPRLQQSEHRGAVISSKRREGAEPLQRLRTAWLNAADHHGVRSVAITAATDDDQVTAVAIGLAIALTRSGRRVLLVSGDLREPTLHEALGLGSTPGLAELLDGQRSFGEVVRHPRIEPRLSVINSGRPHRDPDDLLHAAELGHLARGRGAYDVVIFTTPAVLEAPDAATICRAVDTTLLLVRARSRRRDVATALAELDQAGATMLGALVSGMPQASIRKPAAGPPAPVPEPPRSGPVPPRVTDDLRPTPSSTTTTPASFPTTLVELPGDVRR